MAQVYVKRRKDPVELSDDRAIPLKEKWLDPTTSKERKVDLDFWAGEYGDIVAIEIVQPTKKYEVEQKDYEAEWQAECERFYKLSPEQKAKRLGKFELKFFVRSGLKTKPSDEIKKEAEKIQFEFYKKNTRVYHVPTELFDQIFKREFGDTKVVGLVEKMSVPKVNDNKQDEI